VDLCTVLLRFRRPLSFCLVEFCDLAERRIPARTLYERLGFFVVDESEFKAFMQYRPVALKHIDDPTLDELLKVAVLEASPHEVMPLVPGESGCALISQGFPQRFLAENHHLSAAAENLKHHHRLSKYVRQD
jgi:hypothetical protein